jgi:hypothetical protein
LQAIILTVLGADSDHGTIHIFNLQDQEAAAASSL